MRVFIASLLSAIALFFCGFLWWGVLMPSLQPASVITDQGLMEKMSESLAKSALYIYPDYTQPSEDASKPMAVLYFERQTPSMGTTMGLGFVHMFVTALIVSLAVARLPVQSFARRLAFVCFLGLFVAVWADLGNMIWWRHPGLWTAFHFGYDASSWLIAGLIIAAIVKPITPKSAVN